MHLFYCIFCHAKAFFIDHQLKDICKFISCIIRKINPIRNSAFQSFIDFHKCFHSFIIARKNNNYIISLILHFLKQHCNRCITLYSIRFIYKQDTAFCCYKSVSDAAYISQTIQIHSATLNKSTTF